MMTMNATAGADAHAAAVTAEADLAVLHTNAARTDQEAPESENKHILIRFHISLTYRQKKWIIVIRIVH